MKIQCSGILPDSDLRISPRRKSENWVYSVMKFLFPAIFLWVLSFFVALGQERKTRFDQWDRNADGKLTREELPPNLRKNFERVDTDGDGFISRKEDAAVGQKRRRLESRPPARLPEGVTKIADLDYAGNDNPKQKLDLYLPENPVNEKPLPVIAYIHGGGWRAGDKAGSGRRLAPFVATGRYAGVGIGYRLTGEAQWPSQIHDCKAAIRWIRANAEEHNLDANRIAVWGGSAGGHLVAMLGVSYGVKELEGEIGPHLEQPSEVACVVDFFGPTDLLSMDDHGSSMKHLGPDSPEAHLVGGPLLDNKEKAINASPTTHVSKDDEPFLIVHGDEDPLVSYPQSTLLEEKLEAVGVPVILVKVEGGGHGKGFGPSVDQVVDDFLAKHLLGEKREVKDQVLKAGE